MLEIFQEKRIPKMPVMEKLGLYQEKEYRNNRLNRNIMNLKTQIIVIFIILFSISSNSQSTCYLMTVDLSKKKKEKRVLMYQSIILNEDKTFIWTSLYDLQFTTCGIYEIYDDILELKLFKSDSIIHCEEPDIIENIISRYFEIIPFEKYKVGNNQLYLLNEKGRIKRRVKDNSFKTNIFADIFGKTYSFKVIEC